MSTTIHPELSKKNSYWLPKHRYYELMHFCRQYYDWKALVKELYLTQVSSMPFTYVTNGEPKDIVSDIAVKSVPYLEHIVLVDNAIAELDEDSRNYIFMAVTTGQSYDAMTAGTVPAISRAKFYKQLRKFYYILSENRE